MVYYCKPHEKEVPIDKGRICSINAGYGHIICSFQNGVNMKIKDITTGKDQIINNGTFARSIIISDKVLISAWEQDQKILFKKILLSS